MVIEAADAWRRERRTLNPGRPPQVANCTRSSTQTQDRHLKKQHWRRTAKNLTGLSFLIGHTNPSAHAHRTSSGARL